MSIALLLLTARGRRCTPPEPGMLPIFASVSPSFALSDAMRSDRSSCASSVALVVHLLLAARLLRRRARVCTLPAAIHTSGRRYRRDGVLRTWLRHTGIIMLYLAGVSPGRLARWRDA